MVTLINKQTRDYRKNAMFFVKAQRAVPLRFAGSGSTNMRCYDLLRRAGNKAQHLRKAGLSSKCLLTQMGLAAIAHSHSTRERGRP